MAEQFLEILQDSTAWFIGADPTTIVLTPGPKETKGPGGGRIKAPGTPRAPLTVKLISGGPDNAVSGEGGSTHKYPFVIVAQHDATIEIGDTFKIGDNTFVVHHLAPDNGYEVKAYADSHGAKPTDG